MCGHGGHRGELPANLTGRSMASAQAAWANPSAMSLHVTSTMERGSSDRERRSADQ